MENFLKCIRRRIKNRKKKGNETMKRAKKMLSLLFAMMMVFAIATTVFAANANEHTITITNEKSGHTYSAYQVFAGDLSDGKLTNIQWGSGVNGEKVP